VDRRRNYYRTMEKTIQAVYEGGVLHPLEPLLLPERQQVTVTISDAMEIPGEHPLLVSSDEWADAAQQDIPLEEVRRQLAGIHGTLAEAVIQERRDR
jgi:Protein of unknown function DUF104